jgi:hypothetical protein
MLRLLKNRKALGTVIATLIILVVSVLLASVVTYYAMNVVSTRSQEESLHLTKQHIWNQPPATLGDASYSLSSLMVTNTGGRDVVIDKLAVRGQNCPWLDEVNGKFVVYRIITDPISDDMSFDNAFTVAGDNTVTIGGVEYEFTVAQTDLILPSGSTILIYIINPDSISVNDIGLTVSMTLFSAQAMYHIETNVQAYPPVP